MSNAKIDENDVKTWLAYNETTGLVEPVRVDPVLGYVEVYNVVATAGTYTAIPNAKIDENHVKTLLAWNEDTNLIEAVRSSDNGELIVVSV